MGFPTHPNTSPITHFFAPTNRIAVANPPLAGKRKKKRHTKLVYLESAQRGLSNAVKIISNHRRFQPPLADLAPHFRHLPLKNKTYGYHSNQQKMHCTMRHTVWLVFFSRALGWLSYEGGRWPTGEKEKNSICTPEKATNTDDMGIKKTSKLWAF